MAVGDVRLFSAPLSGFTITVLNPTSAGWTPVAGTSIAGVQSATRVFVMENGIFRVSFNSNASGNSIIFAMFDGAAWQQLGNASATSGDLKTPALLSIDANTGKLAQATMTTVNRNAGVVTQQWVMRRGMSFIERIPTAISGSGSDSSIPLAVTLPAVWMDRFTSVDLRGGFGLMNTNIGANGVNLACAPMPTKKALFFRAMGRHNASNMFFTNASPGKVTTLYAGGDTDVTSGQNQRFIGAIPWPTWGLGDGGGADAGNGNGQFREAEDNFTQALGTWSKVTGVAGTSPSTNVVLRNAAPALNHEVRWTMHFPVAGTWYVGVRAVANAGTPKLDVSVNGTFSGTSVTVPTAAFTTSNAMLVFGPYTVTAPGNYVVGCQVTTLSTMTQLDLDYLAIFPHDRTSDTPTTQLMPHEVARQILRVVTPLPLS